MSMDYIRRTYGVPAQRGGRLIYTDSDGVKFNCTIKSATDSGHLKVLVDDRIPGYRGRMKLHPTWNVEYLPRPSLEVSGVMTRSEAAMAERPLDRNVMRVLHLTLKRRWFDMIASGKKREEYRVMKPYWHKRLMCAKGKFDAIHFRNGYSRDARAMTVELQELRSGIGIIEWGAPEGQEVYILCLGAILQTHNAIAQGREHSERPTGAEGYATPATERTKT